MSGAEIPAAKAVAAAAEVVGKAVGSGEKDDERKQMLELAKASPAMAAAADTYARRLAVRQEIRLKLIQPFARLIGVRADYFEQGQFEADLTEQLEDIPDENLQTPPGHVMGPAMQGLGFTLDEPDLKQMYLRLLAAASDNRRSDVAHPSFAQIIRELSSAEAGLLMVVLSSPQLPIARIKLTTRPNEWRDLRHNVLAWSDASERTPEELNLRAAWIDNWIRLGLVEVTYSERVAPSDGFPDPYEWVEKMPDYPKIEKPLDENGNPQAFPSVAFDPGILRVRDFGRRFQLAVS